jgi:hypothetical protein
MLFYSSSLSIECTNKWSTENTTVILLAQFLVYGRCAQRIILRQLVLFHDDEVHDESISVAFVLQQTINISDRDEISCL